MMVGEDDFVWFKVVVDGQGVLLKSSDRFCRFGPEGPHWVLGSPSNCYCPLSSVGAVVGSNMQCIAVPGKEGFLLQTEWFRVWHPQADGLPEREITSSTADPFTGAGKEESGKDASPTAK
jgi:hypothetical protein